MYNATERLVRVLLDPSSALALSVRDWNDLILTARDAGLLARVAVELQQRNLFDKAPAKAQSLMHAVCISAASSQTAVRFEVNRVARALALVDTPLVLLKGAAYLIAGLPPARGRMLGDLDLMVPLERVDAVEQALIKGGWEPAELDEYDQRFYREWMHEIPPLQHPTRETPIDVHHTIAPRTSRVRPDAAALFDSSVELSPRLHMLGPADMVLHSAVHLFNDEVSKPLRDLLDLHELLSAFSARPQFWDELFARAHLHTLGRPLYYTLRQTRRVFGTAVPPQAVEASAKLAPSLPVGLLMDYLFFALFTPSAKGPGSAFARWLLYVRSHWLRMPPVMLALHLTIKGMRRIRELLARRASEEPE
jgi:hypothetical protein